MPSIRHSDGASSIFGMVHWTFLCCTKEKPRDHERSGVAFGTDTWSRVRRLGLCAQGLTYALHDSESPWLPY